MGRSRGNSLMTFMSAFSSPHRSSLSSSPVSLTPLKKDRQPQPQSSLSPRETPSPTPERQVRGQDAPRGFDLLNDPHANASSAPDVDTPLRERTFQARCQIDRLESRPSSFIQTYQPPLMEISRDTPPELQPIFSFLNSHGSKLYQEGYFLKLDDLDSCGRPRRDRHWTECYGQLVGTVLSLWDAGALDTADADGEVPPTFMNLTDASMRLVSDLQTDSQTGQPLQNVLSLSTAAKNRFLLHFKTFHQMTQWAAAIRLCMYEHASLQELYTGSLIAGKGKDLNNIRYIMGRTKYKVQDWIRVRFSAGTPWRRCWCVITPPDEKEYQKHVKLMKKRSVYDRSVVIAKGDVKLYETKKTKKTRPMATITDAYSVYAIYPQSKPLIEKSTLVKLEGTIKIHSRPQITTEGFIYVLPEVHPGVSGFEMMLRWLFPVFDTFALYGRPGRLIADTLDQRGLMFAMPKDRHYGYLEIMDVANLLHTEGSQVWSEGEWKRRLRELTSHHLNTLHSNNATSRMSSMRSRKSLPPQMSALRFDNASVRSSLSTRQQPRRHSPEPENATSSTTPAPGRLSRVKPHNRSVSEYVSPARLAAAAAANDYRPSNLSHEATSGISSPEITPPLPPIHGEAFPYLDDADTSRLNDDDDDETNNTATVSPEGQTSDMEAQKINQEIGPPSPPRPVVAPPAFAHKAENAPKSKAYNIQAAVQEANIRLPISPLSQLANTTSAASGEIAAASSNNSGQEPPKHNLMQTERGVNNDASKGQIVTNPSAHTEDAGTAGAVVGLSLASTASESGAVITAASPPRPSDKYVVPQHDNSSDPSSKISFNNPSLAATIHRKPVPTPANSTSPTFSRLNSSSIQRKPVPQQIDPFASDENRPHSNDSMGSLTRHVLDDEVIASVGSLSMSSIIHGIDFGSADKKDGRFDDDESESEPDYSSVYQSAAGRARPPPRQRAGVLKTVGTVGLEKDIVIGDVHYSKDVNNKNTSNSSLLDIDFGPTLALDATHNRPASMALLEKIHSNTKSLGPMNASDSALNTMNKQDSAHRRKDSGMSGHSKSPSGLSAAESTSRPSSWGDARRSTAWQPLGNSGRATPASNNNTLTPEEYVHQRVNSGVPVYAHHRKQSSSATQQVRDIKDGSPQHSRHSSNQEPSSSRPEYHLRRESYQGLSSRPNSRSPTTMIDKSFDLSTHLSAREQEHIARMTGTPLINMSSSAVKRPEPMENGTLVGTISAREREKREMKQGYSNNMVQAAIAQRQQFQYQHPQYAMSAQFGSMQPPALQYANHNRAMSLQNIPTMMTASSAGQVMPQSQQWAPPATPTFWNASSTPYQQQSGQQQYQSYGQQQVPRSGYFGNFQGR